MKENRSLYIGIAFLTCSLFLLCGVWIYFKVDVQRTERNRYQTTAVFIEQDGELEAQLILVTDHKTKEVRMVSVPVETYAWLEDLGGGRIESADSLDNSEKAVEILKKTLDLDINQSITFSWKAVADTVNMLHEIEVLLSESEFEYINAYVTEMVKNTGVASKHVKNAGLNQFDGVQTAAYLHQELTQSNFARACRHQLNVAEQIFNFAKQESETLGNLCDAVIPQTETGMELAVIKKAAGKIRKYEVKETAVFPIFYDILKNNPEEFCAVPDSLETSAKELHQFLYPEEPYGPSEILMEISHKTEEEKGR